MNRYVALLCLTSLCVLASCRQELTAADRATVQRVAENRLETAVGIYRSKGIEAVVIYCSGLDSVRTRVGFVTVSCSACADFYDPKAKAVVEGKDSKLPVSVYTRAENGLPFLKDGYAVRDVTISAIGVTEGYAPFVVLHKDIE